MYVPEHIFAPRSARRRHGRRRTSESLVFVVLRDRPQEVFACSACVRALALSDVFGRFDFCYEEVEAASVAYEGEDIGAQSPRLDQRRYPHRLAGKYTGKKPSESRSMRHSGRNLLAFNIFNQVGIELSMHYAHLSPSHS
jgi:hypothetical protein